jgi:GNAT superfamily N-acetyltransferase
MGARKIKLPADFDTVLAMTKVAFQYPDNPTWDPSPAEVQNMHDQMQGLKKMYPILRLLGIFIPTLRNLFNGYLWEEDNKAIGLVNSMPNGLSADTWIIGNVAVDPNYRRRGIARKLVMAGVDLAKEAGAKRIILQVITRNLPAYELYKDLGFETFDTDVELDRPAEAPAVQAIALPAGYEMRPLTLKDWEYGYQLAQITIPAETQKYRPVDIKNYKTPAFIAILRPLFENVGGTKTTRWAVFKDGQAVAILRCWARTKSGGTNQIGMNVHPDHGHLAPVMMSIGLAHLQENAPNRTISMEISHQQTAILAAAHTNHFEARMEMFSMGKIF